MTRTRPRTLIRASIGLALAATALARFGAAADGSSSIERGRYIARIAGCNDCHTPGYAESGGKVSEKDWLVGSSLGWRGPWGTTYASNLRLYMQQKTEAQWVATAHTSRFRPPMPWFALRDMSEQDLRALYRFVRHLGPAGAPAPSFVPPDKAPQGPAVEFPRPPS